MKFYKDNRKIERNQYGRKVERGSAIIADVRVNKNIPKVEAESNYRDPRFEVPGGYYDYSDYSYLVDASYAKDYMNNRYYNYKDAQIQQNRIDRIENKICK